MKRNRNGMAVRVIPPFVASCFGEFERNQAFVRHSEIRALWR